MYPSPQNAVNHRARWFLLAALNEHYPGLLEALVKMAWPSFRACWSEHAGRGERCDPRRQQWIWVSERRLPGTAEWIPIDKSYTADREVMRWATLSKSDQPLLQTLATEISCWATGYSVRDEWLINTALKSLMRMLPSPEVSGSSWDVPQQDHFAVPGQFRPVLESPYWIPDVPVPRTMRGQDGNRRLGADYQPTLEDWRTFESRIIGRVKEQLREYRRAVNLAFAGNQPEVAKHAVWVAKALSGKTRKQIATEEPALKRQGDLVETVDKSIKRFARSIGLTLPRRNTLGNTLGRPEEKHGKKRK